MSLLELITSRRSIRSFSSKLVDNEDLLRILNAARLAPSGGNRQKWKFICVTDPKTLRMVKNSSPGFYGDAPAAIVIGLEEDDSSDKTISLLDIGFTAENILLAAHSLGLGGCAIASFITQSIKRVVNSPDNFEPILIISIGYPSKVPKTPKKKTLFEIVYLNEYGKNWKIAEEFT